MRRILFLLTSAAIAQTLPNAVPMPAPEVQFFGANGLPLAGGKLCSYAAGTNTPQATYTDSTAGTPNTNPVILDVNGRASVWIGPELYKFVLRVGGDTSCSTGAVQWTQDNVTDTTLYFVNYVESIGTATLINYTIAYTGGVSETVSARLAIEPNVKDFGAEGDGSTDDTAAIQAAVTALESVSATTNAFGCLNVPAGTYMLSHKITVGTSAIANNFCITGPPGSNWLWWVTGEALPGIAQFKVTSGFTDSVVWDFTNSTGASMNNISVNGNSGATCLNLGGSMTVYGSSFINCNYGIAGNNSATGGIWRLISNQVSESNVGVYLNTGSDFNMMGNYIHNTNLNYTGTDAVQGDAIYILGGNGNISGGKIEYNGKGIVVDTSGGITITGVNFDTNRWCHICTLNYIPSINITGNRFLAGGSYFSSSLSFGGSAISGNPSTSFQRLTISGNQFSKGADGAGEDDPGPNEGPNNIVSCYGAAASSCIAIMAGNSMQQGAWTNRFLGVGASVLFIAYDFDNAFDPSLTDSLTSGATLQAFSDPIVNSPSGSFQALSLIPLSGNTDLQLHQAGAGDNVFTGYFVASTPTSSLPDYFTGIDSTGQFIIQSYDGSTATNILTLDPVALSASINANYKLLPLGGINLVPANGQTCATLPSGVYGDTRVLYNCANSAGVCSAGSSNALAIYNGSNWKCTPF